MSTKKLDVKTILLGDSAVGKTSLLTRIVRDTFDEDVTSTIGATYSFKSVQYQNYEVQLQIWDTAGQERYRCLAPIYYHDTQIVFLVYSVNDRNSFNIIDFWVKNLSENNATPSLFVLIANKSDLDRGDDGVTMEEGMKKAEDINARFSEVSAKTGSGVVELLDAIAKDYVETLNQDKSSKNDEKMPALAEDKQKEKKCCA